MKILAVLALAFVTACSQTIAETPHQRAFAVQSDYNVALNLAVAYESQPRCGTERARIAGGACSSPAIVAEIRKADTVAYAAVKGMQDTLKAPGASKASIDAVITGAASGVAVLRSVLTTYKIGVR